MRTQQLAENGTRTFALVFDIGEEVIAGLLEAARRHGLGASEFKAIGAFRDVALGYWDWNSREYNRIPVDEQVEVLSLLGNITLDEAGEYRVHAHVVIGKADGTAHGGHLLEAHVRPTLEVILTETPEYLRRRHDERTGLSLLAAAGSPRAE